MEAHLHSHPHAQAAAGEPLVVLTGKALERVRETMRQEGLGSGHGLRLAVTSGGCSGMSYVISFDDQQRDDDTLLDIEGLRVFVDRASTEHLKGITIDYVESLTSAGFKFLNPNATRTCGCGTSFS